MGHSGLWGDRGREELFDWGFRKRKFSDLYYYEKDSLALITNPENPDAGFYWIDGNRSRYNLTTDQVVLLYNYLNEGKKLISK